METRGKSPADELAEEPLTGKAFCWWRGLSEQDYIDIDEIRAGWKAGRYRNRTERFVYQWCKTRFGLRISERTFRTWLHEDSDPQTS